MTSGNHFQGMPSPQHDLGSPSERYTSSAEIQVGYNSLPRARDRKAGTERPREAPVDRTQRPREATGDRAQRPREATGSRVRAAVSNFNQRCVLLEL